MYVNVYTQTYRHVNQQVTRYYKMQKHVHLHTHVHMYIIRIIACVSFCTCTWQLREITPLQRRCDGRRAIND